MGPDPGPAPGHRPGEGVPAPAAAWPAPL